MEKKLNKPTVNTILTMVIRLREEILISFPDGSKKDHVVRWNPLYTEPEVIEPGTTFVNHRGIVDVADWLRELPESIDFKVDRSPIRMINDRKERQA